MRSASFVVGTLRRHVAAFEKLFVEVLKLASASGLLKVGRLALDGTKIKASASRHGLYSNRAMSYERMPTEEVRLQNEIRELLAQAEDTQHGVVIALVNDDIVVTRNVSDFGRIPGIRIENWAD